MVDLLFERGRKGNVIARLKSGKIAFPARGAPQPAPGEWWECEIVKEADRYAIVRPIRRYVKKVTRVTYKCGHTEDYSFGDILPEGEHIIIEEHDDLCSECMGADITTPGSYWGGGDVDTIRRLIKDGVRLPEHELREDWDIDDQITIIEGDGFRIVASEDGVSLRKGDPEQSEIRLLMEIAREMRQIIIGLGHLRWHLRGAPLDRLLHAKQAREAGFPGFSVPGEVGECVNDLLDKYPPDLLRPNITPLEIYEHWKNVVGGDER